MLGADTLDGRGGADEYSAGDGDDEIRAQDGAADSLVCGAGADAGVFDAADAIADDCEFKPAPAALDPAAPGAGLTGEDGDTAPGDNARRCRPGGNSPALPAPAPGRSVSAAPGSGTVLVRTPSGKSFKTLDPVASRAGRLGHRRPQRLGHRRRGEEPRRRHAEGDLQRRPLPRHAEARGKR